MSIFSVMARAENPPLSDVTENNIALHKKVLFSPQPSGSKKENAGLTDGQLLPDSAQPFWSQSELAKWAYDGKVSLAVDLGQTYDISEVAIRLLNGAPPFTQNAGRMFPGWVEVFVSDDGENYTKVTEFSKWNQGEFERFHISQSRDGSSMDTLQFKDLQNVTGRWVGLRIDSTPRTASDEIIVRGTPTDRGTSSKSSGEKSGFTVKHPQIHFHKPYLEIATNLALPLPLGLSRAAEAATDLMLELEIPPGVELSDGKIGDTRISSLKPETLSDGWKRYSFSNDLSKNSGGSERVKNFGKLMLQATSWKNGQKGELRYRFGSDKWQSPLLSVPIHATDVPPAPRLKSIMASLGWWNDIVPYWKDQLDAFEVIGLNTLSVSSTKVGGRMSAREKKAVAQARKKGMRVAAIKTPFSRTWRNLHKNDGEIFDQFADGTVSGVLCPSYRGKFYTQEIRQFAESIAEIQPDIVGMDNEQWGGGEKGPIASRDCLRCQADFKESGLASWEKWQELKGKEILTDVVNATRKAVKESGGKEIDIGSYNVSPEWVYQGVFNFHDLYPEVLNSSQGTTYSNLQPADLVFIGDKARNARTHMNKSDVVPWLTPGDGGSFAEEALQWALLECHINGARGVWFWSNRVWDSESLIAYNKVIRAIAPVEDIIIEGDLANDAAAIEGPGRVSGMKLGNRLVLLAADYFHESDGTLRVNLDIPVKTQLRDLFTGEIFPEIVAAGKQTVSIPLNGERARLLEAVPVAR